MPPPSRPAGRRALEDGALRFGCSDRTVSKLVKDVPRSATRKLARTGSRLTTSRCIVGTALRGEALGCAAAAIVEQLDSTIVVPAGWSGKVDGYMNFILTRLV